MEKLKCHVVIAKKVKKKNLIDLCSLLIGLLYKGHQSSAVTSMSHEVVFNLLVLKYKTTSSHDNYCLRSHPQIDTYYLVTCSSTFKVKV